MVILMVNSGDLPSGKLTVSFFLKMAHFELIDLLKIVIFQIVMFEGSLEVKLPTIWTDGKAEVGRVREEKPRSEKIREEKE